MLIGLLTLSSVPNAEARETEVDGTPIADAVYRGFRANWRKYAAYASELDGGYVFIPHYDRRLDSSRGLSVTEAMEAMKVQREVKTGNLTRKQTVYPDRADAEAYVKALPNLDIGSYGWVDSAEVVEVLGRDEMIVKALWLVDRNELRAAYTRDQERMERETGEINRDVLNFDYRQRIRLMEQQEDDDNGFGATFRLVGYDTRGLRVGDRWEGLEDAGFQVGVVRWEKVEEDEGDDRRRRRSEPEARLVLTELEDQMRRGVDEAGFKMMLAERGMTVADFVDLIRTMRDKDPKNAEERIRDAILPPEIRTDD